MKVHHLTFHSRGDGDGPFTILMDENLGLILPDNPVTYFEVEGFLNVGVHLGDSVICSEGGVNWGCGLVVRY